MSNATKKNRKRPTREKGASLPAAVGFGLLATLFVGPILLLLFTFFLYRGTDPASWSGVLSLSALYPACVLGGFIAAQRSSSAHFFTASLICAVLMTCLSLSIKLINSSPFGLISSVAYYSGIFASFFIGAYIEERRRSVRKRKRKR